MAKNERIFSLDLLKTLATIGIVFHHYQQLMKVTFPRWNYFNGHFYFGYLVELFFVLSGFFMFSYIDKIEKGLKFNTFYIHRALRLLPMIAITAVMYDIANWQYSLCYDQPMMGTLSVFGTIIDSLGVQEGWVFNNAGINNPTWYCSVLLLCYAIFYILTFAAKKIGCTPVYFYIFMILLGCGITTYGINLPFLSGQAARGYYAFFAGVILGVAYKKDLLKNKYLQICSATVAIILLILLKKNSPAVMDGYLPWLLTFILYPAIIVVFVSDSFRKITNFRAFEYLGRLSEN